MADTDARRSARRHRQGLRRRVATIVMLATIAILAALCASTWVVTTRVLAAQVDIALRDGAGASLAGISVPGDIAARDGDVCIADPAATRAPVTRAAWLIDDAGHACLLGRTSTPASFPEAVQRVAAGDADAAFASANLADGHHRLLAVRPSTLDVAVAGSKSRTTLVVGRSIEGLDAFGRRLALLLGGFLGVGVTITTLVAWIASGVAVRPVRQLAVDVEQLARTRDLASRVEVPETGDELAALAREFNALLDVVEQGELERARLVGDASHELRTPLMAVRTNIDLLVRGAADAPEREAMLADASIQVEQLVQAVEDLVLAARRREQGKHLGAERWSDLREVADRAAERARRAPGGRDVSCSMPEAPVEVWGLQAELQRAANNLLDNAAAWTSAGDSIEVDLDARGSLVVTDCGPGFDDADLPHVFARFYRADAARSRPGSGMGLAIVRSVAVAHGGDAVAGHRPDGQRGARVELSLPVRDPKHA